MKYPSPCSPPVITAWSIAVLCACVVFGDTNKPITLYALTSANSILKLYKKN